MAIALASKDIVDFPILDESPIDLGEALGLPSVPWSPKAAQA